MNRSFLAFVLAVLLVARGLQAAPPRLWVVSSPTHEQTYAFGSERHQQWIAAGRDHHLALSTVFTNDPYVDRVEPREYDNFTFDFPDIKLGADGRTFYYHAANGRLAPVATRHAGFLGLEEITLLDNSFLVIEKPHGYLSLKLIVSSHSHSRQDGAG